MNLGNPESICPESITLEEYQARNEEQCCGINTGSQNGLS